MEEKEEKFFTGETILMGMMPHNPLNACETMAGAVQTIPKLHSFSFRK